ncbi:MAG: DUF3606 domain-containing protein [Pseudomonadota bacterium]|nr:DUF3606 domain-containing protein [Pseudomonadota bacterium]
MSDPQNKLEPLDPGRVNSMDPAELQYWCKELHCTEAELKDAVSKVGEHVTVVRQQLASRR